MSQSRIHWISNDDPPQAFPDISEACVEPDGLLAAGGDLSSARLLYAYRNGIFPWYDESQVILWWSPDPRCVLAPDEFHLSRRLRRKLRNSSFEISYNRNFSGVVAGCAGRRESQQGTWITADMTVAYQRLHDEGWAHSVEIWQDNVLVGGLYGLAIGRAFFGESMFSHSSHASKTAMFSLCQILCDNSFEVLDCQVVSPHLLTVGAKLIPRHSFQALLASACEPPIRFDHWPTGLIPAASLV